MSQLQYISSIMNLKIKHSDNSVSELNRRLLSVSPQTQIYEYERKFDSCKAFLQHCMNDLIVKKSGMITNAASKLESLNPMSVLSRGYSIAEKDGSVITSKLMINKDDLFTVRFSDGEIIAKATGE